MSIYKLATTPPPNPHFQFHIHCVTASSPSIPGGRPARIRPSIAFSSSSLRLFERERGRKMGGSRVGGDIDRMAVEIRAEEGGKGEGPRKRQYAVLLCAEDSEYVTRVHGGYFKVFVNLLGEEGDTWHVYRAARGELPRPEEAAAYDGFVISGSCSDAHGDEPWIRNLLALLKELDAMKKKVLGICFGHQILSRALGGKTGRATKGWDIGITCIHPSHSIIKQFSSLHIPSHLPVIEFHRDEILEPPPEAEIVAQSDKTGVEIFKYGNHMMGIQGHPEYTKDILVHLIDRLLRCNLIQNCHAEAARARLNERELEREAWKRLCKAFLKGQF
ncbi:hypothetical protein Cni_G08093 [Canna indica]|uniref:Glutamine amidotransferase domain-containing protein n=1 Tax=Canna indica TaxID=4628 RepID=A0AAQ3K096_9LILI|nr:hypothetical protein Cni_G08093 [Canna indica]